MSSPSHAWLGCVLLGLLLTSCTAAASSLYEPGLPWLAPPGTSFPYKGLHNDLPALARAVVTSPKSRYLTLVTFTADIQRFALNCLYSLVRYGKQTQYIVATFEAETLERCMQLNLPCFNASALVAIKLHNGAYTYGTKESAHIWWAKQRVARLLLHLGYILHVSDVDVVYFRDVVQSYENVFRNVYADAVWATEEYNQLPGDDGARSINMINAGVYAMKPSSRTLRFMEYWLDEWSLEYSDQTYLNQLMGTAYLFCDSASTCLVTKRRQKAAFYRHASFYKGTSCIQNELLEPCDTRRLYLHFLCHRGWDNKGGMWRRLKLWLVNEQGVPLYSDHVYPNAAEIDADRLDGGEARRLRKLVNMGAHGASTGSGELPAGASIPRRLMLQDLRDGDGDMDGGGGGGDDDDGVGLDAAEGDVKPPHAFLPCIEQIAWPWIKASNAEETPE
mmetsp:Transcript_28108/g.61666  ORF Transcript_28108/g.61666 Transcript_28108/m.61666 type:complete len:447 (+) Transcript_28108:95-1435(+)